MLSLFHDMKTAAYAAWETCSSASTDANISLSPKTAFKESAPSGPLTRSILSTPYLSLIVDLLADAVYF